uniref:FXYD domain-containing ion transport regulator n=1 Tax=Spermophilus dauricus TaxID=99837 RepID=A0A8C9PKD6_SPEDA
NTFPLFLPTVPEEPDPFYYDYATVQTVGMTLATIMFVLGIIIILSKKVKCRKADSRSAPPSRCPSAQPRAQVGSRPAWRCLPASRSRPRLSPPLPLTSSRPLPPLLRPQSPRLASIARRPVPLRSPQHSVARAAAQPNTNSLFPLRSGDITHSSSFHYLRAPGPQRVAPSPCPRPRPALRLCHPFQ